jgi:hypothetical protein
MLEGDRQGAEPFGVASMKPDRRLKKRMASTPLTRFECLNPMLDKQTNC